MTKAPTQPPRKGKPPNPPPGPPPRTLPSGSPFQGNLFLASLEHRAKEALERSAEALERDRPRVFDALADDRARRLERTPPPRSHTHDPPTSKRAELEAAPRALSHRAAVLAILLTRPRIRSTEIAELAGQWFPEVFSTDATRRLYQVRRRLSDLHVTHAVRACDWGGAECRWELAP